MRPSVAVDACGRWKAGIKPRRLFHKPLSNLDAKLRVHMGAEIAQLHRQLKTTFTYVTHDQAEAMTMSGRIAVMTGGVIARCPVDSVIASRTGDH